MITRKTLLLPMAGWVAVLLLTALVYLPGLHGSFLFDDYANLPALGQFGPIDHWPVFLRYITSGHADPTGRPLTLLSFLIDARDWPAAAYPFKRTNLIIHLLNGSLLAWLLWRLGEPLDRVRAARAAMVGAALWLLHPLFVSTTLYIVQREAMLPATFVLLGLIAWLHGRRQFATGHPRAGAMWIVGGLGLGTLLAVLSKANGALLPLLALVIEAALLKQTSPIEDREARLRFNRWMLLLGWIPTSIVVLFIAKIGVHAATHGLGAIRPWTEAERLLTEPRILITYLGLLWLPRPFSSGLFNDAIPVSHSIWHPWSTLPALAMVAVLIGGSWSLRKRAPLVATAILFYFAGQLLESTAVPLELYFEHRNYLPALLMFWPLAWWLMDMRNLRALKISVTLAAALLLASMTWARASIWGNPSEQALIWARLNPQSPRAQAYASQFETQHGYPQVAIRRLEPLLASDPSQVQLAFNLVSARCEAGGLDQQTIAATTRAMRLTSNPSSLLTSWFNRAIGKAHAGSCPGLTMSVLQDWLHAGLTNPGMRSVRGRMQDMHYLLGRIALAEGHPARAERAFEQALGYDVRPGFAADAAALLGAAGSPGEGIRILDAYACAASRRYPPSTGMEWLHEWILHRQQYWPHELSRLRATLEEDAKRQEETRATP